MSWLQCLHSEATEDSGVTREEKCGEISMGDLCVEGVGVPQMSPGQKQSALHWTAPKFGEKGKGCKIISASSY